MSYDPTSPAQGGIPVPDASGRAAGRAVVGGAPAGRASVGQASVGQPSVGRATVGRASVASPDAPQSESVFASLLGRFNRQGFRPRSRSSVGAEDPGLRARRKRRNVNIAIAGAAVLVMIAGLGLVVGTYYVDNVELPDQLESLSQSTKIYYSDGTTEMARIGEQNRTNVSIEQVPRAAQDAVVAAEDNSFYTNDGVDYKGIVRAAWNNLTGGERQGASTITQQYARQIADLKGISYGRKIREAVLAVKIKREYGNDKIMEMYLNTVYYGRQAYGIEAASRAYFNKSSKDLSPGEGMALAAMIKQPVQPGTGAPGPYDLSAHPETAKPRFDYVRDMMVKLNFLSQDDATKLGYPTVVPYDPNNPLVTSAESDRTKPSGLILHHVMDELVAAKGPDGSPLFGSTKDEYTKNIRNGGLKVVTTIDPRLQKIAETVGNPDGPTFKSLGLAKPDQLQDALVAVEPGTGRVLAYYGGNNGVGSDYAGAYRDPVLTGGDFISLGRPPGSTMKIYTAMAGLMSGYSIDSTWDATQKRFEGRLGDVTNASNKITCALGATSCTLWESIQKSYNVPFYALTAQKDVTPAKVMTVARDAGVGIMEDPTNGSWIDLTNSSKLNASIDDFDKEVGFGQYPVTVLGHATGTAALAARGLAAPSHFVKSVERGGDKIYAEKIAPKQIPGFNAQMADDISWAMNKVTTDEYHYQMVDGRAVPSKSGTWQYTDPKNPSVQSAQNGDGWFVGFSLSDTSKKIAGLASAVWVGSRSKDSIPLRLAKGGEAYGSQTAGPIWREFMNQALKGTPKVALRPKVGVGDKDQGTGKVAAAPSASASSNGGWPGWPGWPGQNNGQPTPADPNNPNNVGNQPFGAPRRTR